MNTNSILDVLRKQPFRPFRFRLADGRELSVRHPEYVAVSSRQVVVINPEDESLSILKPILIVSIEMAGNGQPSKPQQEAN
jgi:hypothetical protein